MTNRENITNSEKVHQHTQEKFRRERILRRNQKMFDDTINLLIKENYLMIRAKYLDALKDLCMKEAEKG